MHSNNVILMSQPHRISHRSKGEDMERWRAKALQEFISSLCYGSNATELQGINDELSSFHTDVAEY